jgi:hypothetical protein
MSESNNVLQDMSPSERVHVLIAFSVVVAVFSFLTAIQPYSFLSPYSQLACAIAGGALAVALGLAAIALVLLNMAESRAKATN